MNFLPSIFPILAFIAIFVSGVSRESSTLSVVIALPSIITGLLILRKKDSVSFPKNYSIVVLFVAILYAYLPFVKNVNSPFSYAAIFTIGTFYWLIFYNLKGGGEALYDVILKLSITYSFLYLITKVFSLDLVPLSKLYFMEGLVSRHYHVGDLWAFALVLILSKNWGKFDLKIWILLDLGFLFLVLSNARSAYLSLIVGFVYLITRKFADGNYKKLIPRVFLALIIGLFLFASVNKTTLFSRPYFLQSIESFTKYPLGIGMGNFKQIGLEYFSKTGDESKFSLYTHNIFLEALSGVGVFAIVFLVFLCSTAKDIFIEKKRNIEWGAIVLAILANFMFDTTYTIPGLIWVLFMTIGVFQSRD